MTLRSMTFSLADSGLFVEAPGGGARLGDLPLIVLVGVTGVGKSTALNALEQPHWRVLPDRRDLTDAVMILPLAGRAVTDRQERFALSARYRQAHPGGMAQALGELWALDTVASLVFDGLRGLAEVRYAAEQFPTWRFVNLHAPDLTRVRRLLGRADSFDGVSGNARFQTTDLYAELAALDGIEAVFSPPQRLELAGLVGEGHTPAEIVAKTRIVLSERRHYDPAAAGAYLAGLDARRVLDLDTAALDPQQVAKRLRDWLRDWL
ncbi:ATPase [Deinococcus sp.]|uniref:ATPase n=1 Tax=Deinococcus sp. TaxID=47478 RepID=UPI0025EC4940|nr:ATPase [Deinococcus sp.]